MTLSSFEILRAIRLTSLRGRGSAVQRTRVIYSSNSGYVPVAQTGWTGLNSWAHTAVSALVQTERSSWRVTLIKISAGALAQCTTTSWGTEKRTFIFFLAL